MIERKNTPGGMSVLSMIVDFDLDVLLCFQPMESFDEVRSRITPDNTVVHRLNTSTFRGLLFGLVSETTDVIHEHYHSFVTCRN